MSGTESIAKRVRRLAKDYVTAYHQRRNSEARHWLAFAWERGWWTARNEVTEHTQNLADALDAWEAGGDAESLAVAVDLLLVELHDDVEPSTA